MLNVISEIRKISRIYSEEYEFNDEHKRTTPKHVLKKRNKLLGRIEIAETRLFAKLGLKQIHETTVDNLRAALAEIERKRAQQAAEEKALADAEARLAIKERETALAKAKAEMDAAQAAANSEQVKDVLAAAEADKTATDERSDVKTAKKPKQTGSNKKEV